MKYLIHVSKPCADGARHDHRPRHRAKNLARGTSAVGHVSDFVFPSSCSAPCHRRRQSASHRGGRGGPSAPPPLSRPAVTVGGAAARPHSAALPSPRSPWGARRPVRTPPLSRSRPRAAVTAASAPDGARPDAPRHADRTTKLQGRRRGSSLEETRLTTLDGRRGRSRVEICPIWLSYFGARQIDRERGSSRCASHVSGWL